MASSIEIQRRIRRLGNCSLLRFALYGADLLKATKEFFAFLENLIGQANGDHV